MDDLARFWPAWLDERIRHRLLEAYDHPSRGYHDARHLAEVLGHVEELAGTCEVDLDAVLLAAWFHDAVYGVSTGGISTGSINKEPGGIDETNEERSARLAEQELTGSDASPRLVAEVARLVRLTARHDPAPADVSGQVLCDADLAILAAGPERYAEYAAGVRSEHARLSDEDFAAGRSVVLRDLLDRPRLFHTGRARQRWEQAARAAVLRELSTLRPVGATEPSPLPPRNGAAPPAG